MFRVLKSANVQSLPVAVKSVSVSTPREAQVCRFNCSCSKYIQESESSNELGGDLQEFARNFHWLVN